MQMPRFTCYEFYLLSAKPFLEHVFVLWLLKMTTATHLSTIVMFAYGVPLVFIFLVSIVFLLATMLAKLHLAKNNFSF